MKSFYNFMGVAALAVLMFYLGFKRSEMVDMAPYRTENTILRRGIDSLLHVVKGLQEDQEAQCAVIDSLQEEMRRNEVKIIRNDSDYEKGVLRVDTVSVDSLLRFFTEYIEDPSPVLPTMGGSRQSPFRGIRGCISDNR